MNRQVRPVQMKFKIVLVLSRLATHHGLAKGSLANALAWMESSTVLHTCVRNCHVVAIPMLLEARADLALRDCQGNTPMDVAQKHFGFVPKQVRQAFENKVAMRT